MIVNTIDYILENETKIRNNNKTKRLYFSFVDIYIFGMLVDLILSRL